MRLLMTLALCVSVGACKKKDAKAAVDGVAKEKGQQGVVLDTKRPGLQRPGVREGRQPVPAGPRPINFWEVRKGDAVSHLLGTCHLPIPMESVFPAEHHKWVKEAKVFLNEVDLSSVEMGTMMTAIYTPDRWSKTLDDEQLAVLLQSVRTSFPASMADRTQGWLLGSSLVPGPVGAPTDIMDLAVVRMAREAEVPVQALETFEQQMAVVERVLGQPDFSDVAALRQEGMEGFQAVRDLCLRGDSSAMDRLDSSEMGELLDARNLAWKEPFLGALDEGGAFVAVGVGHMFGPTGLLQVAKEEGYTVVRHEVQTPAWTGWKEAPELTKSDPELVKGWSEKLRFLAGATCSNSPMGQCFVGPDQSCPDEVSDGIRLCLMSKGELPPIDADEATVQALAQEMGQCAPLGLVIETMALERFDSSPGCQMIYKGMNQVMSSMLQ